MADGRTRQAGQVGGAPVSSNTVGNTSGKKGGRVAMSESDRVAELEEQVAQLQARLRQVERLTAIGELAGTTTHEFNNILMTIMNYAKMGLRQHDEATRTKALTRILEAGQRAAKITQTILGAARNRSDAFEPVELEQLIRDTLVLLERELSKYRISVELHCDGAPPAMANGNQIQQVLLNLMINARQAMPNGGRLLLAVRPSADDGTCGAADGMVELIVRDTGSGIPADVLPRIFDPFFSTKKGPDGTGKGGTGLGLASCRNIIEAHRGRIRVQSTPGKGTQFTIKLPAAPVECPA